VAVPTLLLPELAGAVARRTGDSSLGLEAAKQVLAWPFLELVPQDDALVTLATQMAAELSVRGADAIYIATARRLGLPLATWDDEQRTRASLIMAAHSPGDGR
jgi:predicted nucleic acid-binding protein